MFDKLAHARKLLAAKRRLAKAAYAVDIALTAERTRYAAENGLRGLSPTSFDHTLDNTGRTVTQRA